MHERTRGGSRGEGERVADLAGKDLLVAGESRKEGKAGRGGTGPAIGAGCAGAQIESPARPAGVPRAGPEPMRIVGFVEEARAGIDHHRVPVARRVPATLNRHV